MTAPSTDHGTRPGSLWHPLRRITQALCLGAMVAGFVTLGALGYQGWRLTHNPYLAAERRAVAPSPEAAKWAADVYREDKRAHLFYTSIFEIGLIAISAGAWLVYRKLDRHLEALEHPQETAAQRARSGQRSSNEATR
jgi:hypothetical protein